MAHLIGGFDANSRGCRGKNSMKYINNIWQKDWRKIVFNHKPLSEEDINKTSFKILPPPPSIFS